MSHPRNSETYLKKADAALKGAFLLLSANDTDGACSRAYYAMFDAAHAALHSVATKDTPITIKTHNGLITLFGQIIIKSHNFPTEFGSKLNQVQTLRELADYSGEPITIERAQWAVDSAQTFVLAVHAFIDAQNAALK